MQCEIDVVTFLRGWDIQHDPLWESEELTLQELQTPQQLPPLGSLYPEDQTGTRPVSIE